MLKTQASTLALAAAFAAGTAGWAVAQDTTEEAQAEDEAVVVEEEPTDDTVIVADPAEEVEDVEGEAVVVEEAEEPAVMTEEAAPSEEVEPAEVEIEGDTEAEEGEAIVVEEVEAEGDEVEVETEEVEVEQPVEGQIFEQSPEEVLGSTLMDATVMSPEGEAVGDVEDVIVSADGQITGVVIGVGGFLGIGEKQVALEYGQIQVQQGEAGELTFMTSATQEELENAPEFRTQDEIVAEEAAVEGEPAVVETEDTAVEGEAVVVEEEPTE